MPPMLRALPLALYQRGEFGGFGLGAALLAPKLIKESRGLESNRKLDVPGAVTITGSVISMVYALSTITQGGFGWLVSLVVSIVLFAAFLVIEQRSPHPLIPLKVVAQRVLLTANLINVLLIGSFAAGFYMVAIADILTLGLIFALYRMTRGQTTTEERRS